ncbi:Rossmann-like and DUF2520 domain-containing protein [Ideonella alba]|uniref:DUF2520 domain-containing protein n=1 Tax=Ideonella alba TaxID=2824118 RepID=A0A941BAU7_9BURK|nr:Rossmann-like and DUF2520 domain-containing protein [Ideonella alba]MBQ0930180.1 DUF2520 domain-containing protein [Ideonella alba]
MTVANASVPRLNLVGAGRVGRTLARLWQRAGVVQVQAVLARQPGSAAQAVAVIGAGQAVDRLAALPPAELWLLAVPDTQIAPVAAALAATGAAPAIAWHASGFLPASEAAPLQAAGWSVASTHPALSFADVDQACAQFPGTLCALEGDAAAVARARAAFQAIGGQCVDLAAADKPLYHAAAVFASNFAPVLQAVAAGLWRDVGLPADRSEALAAGFLQRAAANLQALGPRGALTGPAARGDTRVLTEQGAALTAHDPVLGQAYAALSELARRLAAQSR